MCKSRLVSINEQKLTIPKLEPQAVKISERRKDKILTGTDLKTNGVFAIY